MAYDIVIQANVKDRLMLHHATLALFVGAALSSATVLVALTFTTALSVQSVTGASFGPACQLRKVIVCVPSFVYVCFFTSSVHEVPDGLLLLAVLGPVVPSPQSTVSPFLFPPRVVVAYVHSLTFFRTASGNPESTTPSGLPPVSGVTLS